MWPRVQHVRECVAATTTSGFIAACADRGTDEVTGWTHETKLERIGSLAAFLAEEGIESEDDLRRWLCDPDPRVADEHRAQLLELPGVGPKTVDYLRILSGDQAAVAPDVHLHRFLERAGIKGASHQETGELISAAAGLLAVPPAALDHAIWAYMSKSSATW